MAPELEAKKHFDYFVDGDKYVSPEAHVTGALIKSHLPEAKRGYALYLEKHGDHPDELIGDDTTVDLKTEGLKRFYTVPPATFGRG